MERIFIYKSDEGHRKGCHPVIELWAARRNVINEVHVFSVDEPGSVAYCRSCLYGKWPNQTEENIIVTEQLWTSM